MRTRLVPAAIVVALFLAGCSSPGDTQPTAATTPTVDHSVPATDPGDQAGFIIERAKLALAAYVGDFGLDTGDAYCDLQDVYEAIEFDNVTVTNNANAATGALNQSPYDPDALAAVNDAGITLWGLATVRAMLNDRLLPLIDDPEAASAMAFVSDMNNEVSIPTGKMLAEATSARDLALSLTAFLATDASQMYAEGQVDAYTVLNSYRDQRCA